MPGGEKHSCVKESGERAKRFAGDQPAPRDVIANDFLRTEAVGRYLLRSVSQLITCFVKTKSNLAGIIVSFEPQSNCNRSRVYSSGQK